MRPLEAEFDPQRPVIAAVQAGDAHALAEFIHSQGRWIRAVVFGVLGPAGDIDDVCQRVWIQIWRESHNLEDPARWKSWVYRIARNAATDAARSGQRRKKIGVSGGETDLLIAAPASEWSGPERQVMAKEQHQAVLTAIECLPELYREPFVLKHVEGWSYAQIADAMSLPVDTVETRLVRARRLLREKLTARI